MTTRPRFRADDPDGVVHDQIMAGAWAGFLHFAYGNPEARVAFTRETGIAWPAAPTSAIDAMVDAATGYQEHACFMCAQWATVRHFGLGYAPEAFQAACRERPCWPLVGLPVPQRAKT